MKNPLSRGLLDVAKALTTVGGGRITRQAALRRAASSAYYALYHSLCQLCGDGLRLWTVGGDDLQQAYRSVDHGRTSDVLAAASTRALHPDLDAVARAFAQLRTLREDADYSQPGRIGADDRPLTQHEIETLIGVAEEAAALVDALPVHVRRRLAILLLTGTGGRRSGRSRR